MMYWRKGVIHVSVKFNAKVARKILIDLEMDQKDLAARSGVTPITISRLMQGHPFNSETLGKVALALGCHPVDLIDANGFASPHVGAPATANIHS
jgi:DNA-binding Xre family transcriptional regulator